MTFPFAEFKALYPDLVKHTKPSTLKTVADMAKSFLPRGCHDLQEQLWMLVTAHMLILRKAEANGGTNVGAVTSASVGSVSVSYAQIPTGNSSQKAWLAMTPYGLQFLALRARCAGTPRYVGGSPASKPWRCP